MTRTNPTLDYFNSLLKNTEFKCVEYETQHGLDMDLQDEESEIKDFFPDWEDYAAHLGRMLATGGTLTYQGRPILIGGLIPVVGQTYEAFLLCSKDFKDVVQPIKKVIIEIIAFYTHKLLPKGCRINAVVRQDFARAIRFIEKLGFTRDGAFASWGKEGNDVYMYGKLT